MDAFRMFVWTKSTAHQDIQNGDLGNAEDLENAVNALMHEI